MSTYKTAGIVIKSFKLGEADKIVTFLTSRGRLSAVAKGIRRTTSKFAGRLEPGNDLDLLFAKGRSLDRVTQVEIRRLRPWLRSDLDKLQTAYAMLELVDKLATEAVDDRLLRMVSAGLDRLEIETRRPLLLLAFDLKAVALTGWLPFLAGCVLCGRENQAEWLGLSEGGLICRNCFAGQTGTTVDAKTLGLISELLSARFAGLDSVNGSPDLIEKAKKAVWSHIEYHVHGEFKARAEGLIV